MSRGVLRWRLDDEGQTLRAGHAVARVLKPGDVVGLVGDLGAGKTCLVRGILGGLFEQAGHDTTRGTSQVSSPTYTLMHHYDGPGRFDPVLHVDLYRLEDEDDLESTGYWDAVEDAGLILVEWIDTLSGAWPGAGVRLQLHHTDATRELEVSIRGGY
ncbi:MAG: tRNA (adenosine(37)-N6)-threonylcarbamoyltransferase complex ATPase subunit type 1 TsaE, partial [Myxococcota bacterium]